MKLINLTPHAIVIRPLISEGYDHPFEGTAVVVPASGDVARVATLPSTVVGDLAGIPVVASPSFGDVVGLPAPQDGVAYIVSGLVLSRAFGRTDVFAPDTGATAIRENGQIVAVRGLVAAPTA
jgi:hypothetical protein